MARNTGKRYRQGAQRGVSQVYNSRTGQYVKRDKKTGRIIGSKKGKYKGIRRVLK